MGPGNIYNRLQLSPRHVPRQHLSWGHLSRQHLSWGHLSILGISQLLLTQFWPNFKGWFLGLSLTDAHCHGAICSRNICPGDNCPYRHNLSCYWPNFDQIFFWNKNLFGHKIFPHKKFFFTQIFLPKFFFLNRILFGPLFLGPNFFGFLLFVDQHLFWKKNFLWPKYF